MLVTESGNVIGRHSLETPSLELLAALRKMEESRLATRIVRDDEEKGGAYGVHLDGRGDGSAVLGITASVLALEIDGEEESENNGHRSESHSDTVSAEETRTILGAVERACQLQ